MILLIDNYDSFSYNLFQMVGEINPDIKVIRNDEMTLEEIEMLEPSHIILSPGPGRPADAGICEKVVDYFKGKVPILGVCLGHQAICEVFGGTIGYADKLMHGKTSMVTLDLTSKIFGGMEPKIQVARYHSLATVKDSLLDNLKVIARTESDEIMAVEHVEYPIYGVQFHPESILTPNGKQILERFLNIKIKKEEEKFIIKDMISKVAGGTDLNREEALSVMDEIMGGKAAPAQIAAFLTGLHIKGETSEEISACAEGMRKFATKVDRHGMDVIDIVGTGGDRSNTFNISTAASFVTSAAGIAVAKHGNRAASSKCGTADCLEALGVNLMLEPEKNSEVLQDLKLCFMFAQKYHTAMRYVGPVRKDIGVPTVFNILGPLTNPSSNTHQLLGVYKEDLVEPIAEALKKLGLKAAMVVYGTDCLDEISLSAPTIVCELKDGDITRYEISPEQFGIASCNKSDLEGGTPEENAQIIKDIFTGKLKGAKRDVVVLNAGAAIHIVKGVSIDEGIKIANEMIDSGAALKQLEQFVEATNS